MNLLQSLREVRFFAALRGGTAELRRLREEKERARHARKAAEERIIERSGELLLCIREMMDDKEALRELNEAIDSLERSRRREQGK